MPPLNGLIYGAVAVICFMAVVWGIMFYIYYKGTISINPVEKYKNFAAYTLEYRFLPKLLSSKLILTTMIISVILCALFIGLLAKGLNDTHIGGIPGGPTTVNNLNKSLEHFGNAALESASTSTYVPIGYGPVIDKTKVKNWVNGKSSINGLTVKTGETAWLDGNGIPIAIPTNQFKALYGYIPPSFAYFPKGQAKNDYNFENYKEGREKCMQACSLTNCVAVQTEVPENCS